MKWTEGYIIVTRIFHKILTKIIFPLDFRCKEELMMAANNSQFDLIDIAQGSITLTSTNKQMT
jgi:hypothetical protein